MCYLECLCTCVFFFPASYSGCVSLWRCEDIDAACCVNTRELSTSLQPLYHFWDKQWNLYMFWGGGAYSSFSSVATFLAVPATYTPRVSLCVCLYASTFGVAGRGCGDRVPGFWLTDKEVEQNDNIRPQGCPGSKSPISGGLPDPPKDQWAGSLGLVEGAGGPGPGAQRGQSAWGEEAEWHIDRLIYIITTMHPDKWAPGVGANHLGE